MRPSIQAGAQGSLSHRRLWGLSMMQTHCAWLRQASNHVHRERLFITETSAKPTAIIKDAGAGSVTPMQRGFNAEASFLGEPASLVFPTQTHVVEPMREAFSWTRNLLATRRCSMSNVVSAAFRRGEGVSAKSRHPLPLVSGDESVAVPGFRAWFGEAALHCESHVPRVLALRRCVLVSAIWFQHRI